MKDYQQVIALAPDRALAYVQLSWLLLGKSHIDEARSMINKAYALNPGSLDIMMNLGRFLLVDGDEDTARRYFLEALNQLESDEQFKQFVTPLLLLESENILPKKLVRRTLAWIQQVDLPRRHWRLLYQEAITSYYEKDAKKAEDQARAALEMAKRNFGLEHLITAKSLDMLALTLYQQWHYEKAEDYSREALAIKERILDKRHSAIAVSYNQLANLLYEEGRDDDAEQLYRQALEVADTASDIENLIVSSQIRNNLATLLADRVSYSDAESLLRHALKIDEKVYGLEHPITATTSLNLAHVLHSQAHYGEAELLLCRALTIDEKVKRIHDPQHAKVLNQLCILLNSQGRDKAAEPLCRQALDIFEQTMGDEDTNTLNARNSLAEVLHQLGQDGEAEKQYWQALETEKGALDKIKKQALGERTKKARETLLNNGITITSSNLANMLADQKRYPEAINLGSIWVPVSSIGYVSNSSKRGLSSPLPRRRTLCTNWKKPK